MPKASIPERILIVNPEGLAERGGMGRMVRYLVGALKERPGGPAVEVLDSRGKHSAWFAPFYLARTLLQILRRHAAGAVRLVHVNMAENTSVLRKGAVVLLCRALGIPCLLHLHAGAFISFSDRLPGFARAFLSLVFRSADMTIVLGALWKRYLVEELGVDPARIAVVPNGVASGARRPLRTNEPCRLIYVGKLRYEKGLAELLDALSQPDLRALPWSLTLVGDGARAAFEEHVAEGRIAERVRFRGWLEQDAVAAELAQADVYVLPSHYEGMPLAVLEALSAGLAVVTTAVGALPEILTDGINARLVPPKDVIALHDALLELVQDQDLRERLAEAGHALYTERFTVDAFTDAIVALYEQIAPRKPAPRLMERA